MGFPRQVYWSGLPFPSPGVLPDPGIEPVSPKNWQVGSLPLRPLGSPLAIFPYGNTWPQQCVNSQNRKTERRAKDESREKVPIWNVVVITVVQSLSNVWLFATPWTATLQASLSFTITWSVLKFMSIELVMLSKHLILCCSFSCPQSFPASWSFPTFVGALHQVTKLLELQLQHQSIQWICRVEFL